MTPAERERLHLLQATLLHAAGVVSRTLQWDNWESTHPDGLDKARNRVERALGEITNAQQLMIESTDIKLTEVHRHSETARTLTKRFLTKQERKVGMALELGMPYKGQTTLVEPEVDDLV